MKQANIKAGILGHTVGDALGVPVEFKTREELRKNPVKTMRSYGTYNQPQGTWSDDSSLTFCLLESLCTGYNLEDIGTKFVKWLNNSYWTPHGETFDVGNTTRQAIKKIENGSAPAQAGGNDEYDNGNGSLMRILPLVYYTKEMLREERLTKVKEVSSITHAHRRAIIGCSIYMEFAINLLDGDKLDIAYKKMQKTIKEYYKREAYKNELSYYQRILDNDISELKVEKIKSSGYVVDTLEAVLWLLLNEDSYRETVLKAVNLGQDTDTVAAIAGGLAGIYYGYQSIPKQWLDNVVMKKEILELIERFYQKVIV